MNFPEGESSLKTISPFLEDILKRILFNCESTESKQIDTFLVLIILLLSENGFLIMDHNTKTVQCLQLIDNKQLSKWKLSTGAYEVLFVINGFRDVLIKLILCPVGASSLVNVFISDICSEVYTVCLSVNRYIKCLESSNIPMMFWDLKHLSETLKNKIITPVKSTILTYYGYSSASLVGLPEEVIFTILLYLSVTDIINVAKTCKKFNNLSNNENFWHKLVMRDFNNTSTTNFQDWKTLYKNMYIMHQDSRHRASCLRGTLHDLMDISDYVSYIDNPMWEDII